MINRRSKRLAEQQDPSIDSSNKENIMPRISTTKKRTTKKEPLRRPSRKTHKVKSEMKEEEESDDDFVTVPVKKRCIDSIEEEAVDGDNEQDAGVSGNEGESGDEFFAVSDEDKEMVGVEETPSSSITKTILAFSPGKKGSVMEMLMACENGAAQIPQDAAPAEKTPKKKGGKKKGPSKKKVKKEIESEEEFLVSKKKNVKHESKSDEEFSLSKKKTSANSMTNFKRIEKQSPGKESFSSEIAKPTGKRKTVPQLTEEEREVRRFAQRCVKKRETCVEQCTLTLGLASLRHCMIKLQSSLLQNILLSVIPDLPELSDLESTLNHLILCFRQKFTLAEASISEKKQQFYASLMELVTTAKTPFENTFVSLFCSALLALGFDARLVRCLSVPSLNKLEMKKKNITPARYLQVPEWWVEVRYNDVLAAVDVVNEVVTADYFRERVFLIEPGYIVSISSELALLDSTAKYSLKWAERHRKARALHWEWWIQLLEEQKTSHQLVIKEHKRFMKEIMLGRGFPSSLSGFKNNLVYALEKDLLKIEAFYPPKPEVLGTFKSHAVYSRECVRSLKQIIVILKEGRQLREGEVPYKIVKQKILYDRYPGDDRWKDMPLYGDWQTQWYKPRPAENGKVPRNDFGNVELFKPWMLPPGTVHLNLPGTYSLARKLGIDAAHAVTGFEFARCRAVPVTNGVIVCEEFAETLCCAWEEQSRNHTERTEEKRVEKIYDNWKLLIKSLLIKEKILKKYDMTSEEGGSRKKKGGGHVHVYPARSKRKDKVTGQMVQKCSCGLVVPVESCEEEL